MKKILFAILIASCSKGEVLNTPIQKSDTLSVTFVFKESRVQIIHWHKVWDAFPDSFLTRYKQYPKYSEIGCDLGMQELIIAPKCSNNCKK